jgi:hypothetical protein
MMIELDIYSEDADEVELVERYWGTDGDGNFKEKVADLLPFRNIATATQLVGFINQISQAWDRNQLCPKCGDPETIKNRSEIKKSQHNLRSPCSICEQEEKRVQKEAQIKYEAELKERLDSYIGYCESHSIDYCNLPDDIVLILVALERAINPRLLNSVFMRGDCRALAPSYVGDFVTKLYKAEVILDDPRRAQIGAYYLKEGKLWHKNDLVVYFLAPDSTHGASEEAFAILTGRNYRKNKLIFGLWLDYATADCMSYFFTQCDIHNLGATTQHVAEIYSTLRSALHTYSVSEMWSMIWMVVRDAASLSTREYYNSEKASATIPGKMLRFLERVKKGTAQLKQWDRPDLQPAGTLGQVLSDVFGIDEYTAGANLFTYFIEEELLSIESENIKANVLAESVRDLFQNSLTENTGAAVLSCFADLIRKGMSTEGAIDELTEIFKKK